VNKSLEENGQPLYTPKVEVLPAATQSPFGRQGDAFGVVVGKLTKKNTCQSPRGSNTVNQTHRMKGYRRGFSESSFLLDDLSRLFAFAV
jgi:hypothetical protein